MSRSSPSILGNRCVRSSGCSRTSRRGAGEYWARDRTEGGRPTKGLCARMVGCHHPRAVLFWHANPRLIYPTLAHPHTVLQPFLSCVLSFSESHLYRDTKLNWSLTILASHGGRSVVERRAPRLDLGKVQKFRFNDGIVVTIHHLYTFWEKLETLLLSQFFISDHTFLL